MPPPDYFAGKIVVLIEINCGRDKAKHKSPPARAFFVIMQFMYEKHEGSFWAVGSSRGAMWLEHALKEIPHCFQAVMLCGSYANTDKASGAISNQRVMSEALHLTPVPTMTFMAPTDRHCGLKVQRSYWANLMTVAGPIVVPNSRLRIQRL